MRLGRATRNIVISAITIVVSVAVGFSALLYFTQDQLIFLRQPPPDSTPFAPGASISEVHIPTIDGLALRGWLAKPALSTETALPLAIYFGGNAEEISYIAGVAPRLQGASVLAVNYRGYGGNDGQPSEHNLYADALAIYDWADNREDVIPTKISAIGRSLGSGVAVYLAAQRQLTKLVLVTPYDSLRAVAQHHYPFVPVSLLLKHPFDSIKHATGVQTPMLVIAAERDRIVPVAHARSLFDQWSGPKIWREFPGADHNSLDSDPGYWDAIAAFLAE